MKKISTLFKKDPNDLKKVINKVSSENQWVYECGVPTRKYDGTACAIFNGRLYKRYDVKKGRDVPAMAIACQEPDAITGHWPHWVICNPDDNADRYHIEAFKNQEDGTYELVGPKINGNKDKFETHELVAHGKTSLTDIEDFSFAGIRSYLESHEIEGIVFHAKDLSGRMCKIRRKDFGFKW